MLFSKIFDVRTYISVKNVYMELNFNDKVEMQKNEMLN